MIYFALMLRYQMENNTMKGKYRGYDIEVERGD